MSRINIGGFNLNSEEIINVKYDKAWYTKWLEVSGSIIFLLSIMGIIGIFMEQNEILERLFSSIFAGIFGYLLYYLSDKKLNHFKMTVTTMNNGQVETHIRYFNTNKDILEIYKKLKEYIK